MKLLLTSKGLYTENIMKAFLDLLTKPVKEDKVQIIAIKPKIPDFDMQAYIDEDKQRTRIKRLERRLPSILHHW